MSAEASDLNPVSTEPIAMVARLFERDLRKKLGLSRNEAKAFMSAGWAGLLRTRDPAEAQRQEGKQVVAALSALLERIEQNGK